jgi:hypothetical protein
MKSIKQQYIDLTEGRMSQANFMRNLRMTLPQYITNVTSFNDSVKILRNKGILSENEIKMTAAEEMAKSMGNYDSAVVALQDKMGLSASEADRIASKVYPEVNETKNLDVDPEELKKGIETEKEHTDDSTKAEQIALDHLKEDPKYYTKLKKAGLEEQPLNEAKDEKGKWTNANGKSMYDQFKEIDNLNGQEVLIGLDWEMEKNEELSKKEAAKIVIKNLKKNPLYYTMTDLAGKEGAEAEYMGGKSAQPEARQMQPLEKNMGNIVDKKMGMQLVKDVEKAKKDSDAATAQKYKTSGISLMSLVAKTVRGVKKMDATGEKMKTVKLSEGQYTTNWHFSGDEIKKIKGMIDDAEFDVEKEEDTVKTTVTSKKYADKNIEHAVKQATGQLKSSPVKPGIGDAIQKPLEETAEDRLAEQISQYVKEITGAYGGDAMDAEDGSSYENN